MGILSLLVFLGGAIGTLLRYGLTNAISSTANQFDLGIFVANISGAALLGGIIGYLDAVQPRHSVRVRALAGTGICGGLTTFSTLCAGVVGSLRAGNLLDSATYLLTSILCGVAALTLSYLLVRKVSSPANSVGG